MLSSSSKQDWRSAIENFDMDAHLRNSAQFVTNARSQFEIAHKRILVPSLAEYFEQTASRNEAMEIAYRSGVYTMAEIAAYFNMHYMTVSSVLRVAKGG